MTDPIQMTARSGEQDSAPATARRSWETPMARRRWTRAHSLVVRCLRRAGVATAQQLVAMVTDRGPSVRHTWRVLAHLQHDGWVQSFALRPERGAASPRVMRLSDATLTEKLGERPPRRPRQSLDWADARVQPLVEARLELDLQWVEVRLVRGRERWTPVEPARAWTVLRDAHLAMTRRQTRTELDDENRRLLQRHPEQAMPTAVLIRDGERPRVLLPVSPCVSIRSLLDRLPSSLALMGTVVFELVVSDRSLTETAEDLVRRWGEDRRVATEVIALPSYRLRRATVTRA